MLQWSDTGYVVGTLFGGVVTEIFDLRAAVMAVAGLSVLSGLVVGTRMRKTAGHVGQTDPSGRCELLDAATHGDVVKAVFVLGVQSQFELGSFPPRLGQFGWQASLFHAGLRFFEMELADSLFFSPGDWSLCRRMLRAGVRFAISERKGR